MSRLRGLLPGVLIVVVLPLTLALIAIAIGATTLHQNEMRDLIAQRDERTVREAANTSGRAGDSISAAGASRGTNWCARACHRPKRGGDWA